MRMQVLLLTLLFPTLLFADVYLQSVRGSNNRLDEANRERNNGNRLFDSQNNDRGGYNVGKMTWYVGERLPIGWMVQHGCGTDDVSECEVVLQALCDEPGSRLIRDGTTTQRIPDNPANCRNFNCDTDMKYGRHESYAWYKNCEQTKRNDRLFQASQKPNRGDATRTRQNPGGTRRGYECPEERDYYPYWRPTPFYDLAYWSKKTDRCDQIRAESQNVKSRWHCVIPEFMMENNFGNNRIAKIPIREDECIEILGNDPVSGNETRAQWVEVPSHGIPEPECLTSEASRPNHLGLIGHRKQWTMNYKIKEWMLAGQDERACVFRLRYNITQDHDSFEYNSQSLKYDTLSPGAFTSDYNANRQGGNANTRPATWPLWREYGITDEEVGFDAATNTITAYPANGQNHQEDNKRDWVLRNNPQPQLIPEQGGFKLRLQLAVNTAQYGRTFQDRTHVTTIKARPASVGDAPINAVMVQGKRGNIVQVFPATEYFYQPEVVHAPVQSYVHWVFSGSDTNPNNNDGQGKQGTDRSNAISLKDSNYDADATLQTQGGETVVEGNVQHGSLGNSYPAYVSQPKGYTLSTVANCRRPDHVATPMGGIDQQQLEYLATLRQHTDSGHDHGNMEELDDAGTSVNLLTKVTQTGCWNYMGSRNNNFSNRDQKGTMCVDNGEYEQDDVGPGGKALMSESGWVNIPAGSLASIQQFTFSTDGDEDQVSDKVLVQPEDMSALLVDGRQIELGIDYEHRALRTPKLYHKSVEGGSWSEVSDAKFKKQNGKNVCVVWVNQGGYYQVQDTVNGGAVAAIVCSGIVFCCAICFMTWWQFFKDGQKESMIQV